ncbi:MAG TPA: nicotinate (nicotinamide) nucleotide adenylyltransferase [Spirochaetota bacterium]|nr:nicotinate (nicotinamide) nucleotide adenylyltransferase [Spirochaetota bacterium]
MRTGILGGTFNPIHYGHLINAQMIAEEFALDRVLFVPSKAPVHKALEGNATAQDRLRMVERAIEGNDTFRALDIELVRDAPSYTLFTVRELVRLFPEDHFHLIIGLDSYREIHTWYRFEELLKSLPVIVMNRPDAGSDERNDIPPHKCHRAHNPYIQISSSLIRGRRRDGSSIRYLVPPTVDDYIQQRGLYTT